MYIIIYLWTLTHEWWLYNIKRIFWIHFDLMNINMRILVFYMHASSVLLLRKCIWINHNRDFFCGKYLHLQIEWPSWKCFIRAVTDIHKNMSWSHNRKLWLFYPGVCCTIKVTKKRQVFGHLSQSSHQIITLAVVIRHTPATFNSTCSL